MSDKIKEYDNAVKQTNVVNEFLSAFADKGVVFTDQEINIIFNRYATKFRDVVEHINKGETQ
tara:strand:- start:445 stop:630 length:186 start_codon:yes stop_codon:yes gene_type:complete